MLALSETFCIVIVFSAVGFVGGFLIAMLRNKLNKIRNRMPK